MRNQSMTYADAGVDARKISEAHKILKQIFESTFRFREGKVGFPIDGIGHYAGLIDVDGSHALGLHVDGVGTKAMIAQMMKKYDTIGIDCVAMCVNDLICTGCEPTSFLDYIAVRKIDLDVIKQIGKGIAEGAKRADVAVIGGETAVIPEMLSTELDLVGMALGIRNTTDLVLGDNIKDGDILVGLRSSGIHANGLTLARKLLEKYSLDSLIPQLGTTLGEELLRPTEIYVKAIMEALKKTEIHGLAHITSTSFMKLNRIMSRAKLGASIDSLPSKPKIFDFIEKEVKVPHEEMLRTFNQGIGFVTICPESEMDKAIDIFEKFGHDSLPIGRVVRDEGVVVEGIRIV
jgi:phosphoribosylformylglycinamidine cyclo-ligase